MHVADIAKHLNRPFEGNGETLIADVAPLEEAGPADIAFAGSRKAVESAEQSRAGCLLVPAGFPPGRTLIRVPDPRAAFASVIPLFHPPKKYDSAVHPTAAISETAAIGPDVSIAAHVSIGAGTTVGKGTRIGPGCRIGDNVQIGEDCLLHAGTTLYDNVTLGNRVVLHSGSVIGADGFGFARVEGHYEKFPQIGRVEIHDDVEIGANSCVDRAALGVTVIGEGAKLDNMVHIGHNCRIGRNVVIAAQTGLSGGVIVEDDVVIGGQVGIGDKARIETGAVLGSGCGILTSKIVRKGQVVWGTPARPLREYLALLARVGRLHRIEEDIAFLKRRMTGLRGIEHRETDEIPDD
ncbi:MAG: UDP-3-O-(3-hydroxymyristoyl)glucosamine N-acyltransferase [Bryobacteraceae bacterium]